MTDDFTAFWRNNEHASALFYDLLARAENDAYDDDFLMRLTAYREAAPESERADVFAARYLLAQNDAETACICAERAYRRRPVNYEVWKLLAEIYTLLDRPVDALTMYGYAHGLYLSPEIPLDLIRQCGREGLNRLSIAAGLGTGTPTTPGPRVEPGATSGPGGRARSRVAFSRRSGTATARSRSCFANTPARPWAGWICPA